MDNSDGLVEPRLRRLVTPWLLPAIAPLPGQDSATNISGEERRVDYEWVGPDARLAGTVVHRWLQLAAEGRVSQAAESVADTRDVSRRWLRELGASDDILDVICDRVEEALAGIFSDRVGQWLLAGPGDAELPLQGVVEGRIESIVIDRVKIDEDDTHWIVDYKTSSHEGGDLDGFLLAESERYRDQLRRYASVYASYAGTAPRCALYFPLLQRFVEVEV